MSGLASRVALQRAEKLLVSRLEALHARLESGDQTAAADYCEAARTLAALLPLIAPEASRRLLTTAELAEKIGVSPKTLLRHKATGKITPAVARGKLIRWRGTESL